METLKSSHRHAYSQLFSSRNMVITTIQTQSVTLSMEDKMLQQGKAKILIDDFLILVELKPRALIEDLNPGNYQRTSGLKLFNSKRHPGVVLETTIFQTFKSHYASFNILPHFP